MRGFSFRPSSRRRRGSRRAMARLPLAGLITAGALVAGSCTGAVVGHYTVTGGFSPGAGWQVPSFGTDQALADLPPAVATAREVPKPQYAGYYPAQASDVADPGFADAAAHDFDALYDEPVIEPAVQREPEAFAEPQTTDLDAYWEPADPAG